MGKVSGFGEAALAIKQFNIVLVLQFNSSFFVYLQYIGDKLLHVIHSQICFRLSAANISFRILIGSSEDTKYRHLTFSTALYMLLDPITVCQHAKIQYFYNKKYILMRKL